jgi:hypothetical protein
VKAVSGELLLRLAVGALWSLAEIKGGWGDALVPALFTHDTPLGAHTPLPHAPLPAAGLGQAHSPQQLAIELKKAPHPPPRRSPTRHPR